MAQQPVGDGLGRVLLIGDVGKALQDARSLDRRVFEVRENILDGIDAATRKRYEAVGIVMGGASSRLAPALRALRRSTTARIILLARMHEEPIARRLVTQTPGEERLADEYHICPARTTSLYPGIGSKGEADREPKAQTSDLESQIADAPPQAAPADSAQRVWRLEHLATTDDLTGLKNRRYTWEFARQILDRARQAGGRVTLLVFDIDDFKHYNDVYGHLAGDEILRQAAILMRR